MLWCSLRNRDTSDEWIKEFAVRQKTEIQYIIDTDGDQSIKKHEVSYSSLLDEINIIQAYQKLADAYETGQISASEFLELSEPLTDKIDIKDILEV